MMRLVLNAHAGIAIPGETGYFYRIDEPYRGRPDRWQAAVETFVAYCEQRYSAPVDWPVVSAGLVGEAPDYGVLLSRVLAAVAAAEGKARWGEKTPRHMFYADRIIECFPDARVLVMQRDPRAVVASMNRFQLIASSNSALHARHWLDIWTEGRTVLENSVPEPQRMIMRYEELIAHPEPELRRVCEFIGEPYEESMLSFHLSSKVLKDREHQLRQPIGGDPFAWRDALDARDVAIVEAVCGPVMEPMGYVPEGRRLRARERAVLRGTLGYVSLKQRQHPNERHHDVLYPAFGRLRRAARRSELHQAEP